MALDVEQEWCEQFADVLAAARAENRYTPTWYTGSSFAAGGAAGLASSLARNVVEHLVIVLSAGLQLGRRRWRIIRRRWRRWRWRRLVGQLRENESPWRGLIPYFVSGIYMLWERNIPENSVSWLRSPGSQCV